MVADRKGIGADDGARDAFVSSFLFKPRFLQSATQPLFTSLRK